MEGTKHETMLTQHCFCCAKPEFRLEPCANDANELGLNMMWVNKCSEMAPLVRSIIE